MTSSADITKFAITLKRARLDALDPAAAPSPGPLADPAATRDKLRASLRDVARCAFWQSVEIAARLHNVDAVVAELRNDELGREVLDIRAAARAAADRWASYLTRDPSFAALAALADPATPSPGPSWTWRPRHPSAEE